MNSFISASRIFLPLLAAFAAVLLIEAGIALLTPSVPHLIRSQLLHFSYYKPIRAERVISAIKLEDISKLPGDIVQVGDSSGLAASNPAIMDKLLPRGLTLLNMNMQVPAQYEGFETAAHIALTAQPRRYLMLFVAPFHIGADDEGFGEDIRAYYEQWTWAQLLPSLSWRNAALNWVYYQEKAPVNVLRTMPDGTQLLNYDITGHSAALAKSKGWIELNIKSDFAPHPCTMPRYDSDRVHKRLKRFYDIAQQHNTKLILAFGPIRCTPNESTEKLESDVNQFLKAHPDVIVPTPIINTIDPKLLGDSVHLTPEGSSYYSKWFAKKLAKVLD